MEEQHTFGKFGYFHVPCHKYQPTKVTLCLDLKPLPPHQHKSARFSSSENKEKSAKDFEKNTNGHSHLNWCTQRNNIYINMDINAVLCLSYA